MSNYNSLKTTIDANIKQNGNEEITGQILNSVLNAMVTTLGAGYQFAGIATTKTDPGTPDAKVFYIANGKGTYTHFNNIEVTEDEVVVLYYDTEWHKVATGIASNEKLTELGQVINSIKLEMDSQQLEYDGEETPTDTYFVGTFAIAGYIVNDKFNIRVDSLSGSGLRIKLFFKDGTVNYGILNLGNNWYNSNLSINGFSLYHKASSGSLNVVGKIFLEDNFHQNIETLRQGIGSLNQEINNIEELIPNNATPQNQLVTDDEIYSIVEEWNNVPLTMYTEDNTNGYYNIQGQYNFIKDNSRRASDKIIVSPGERYKVTTNLRSTAIAGVAFWRNSGSPLSCMFIGTGVDQVLTDEEFVIPENAHFMAVSSTDSTEPTLKKQEFNKVFKSYSREESDARYGELGNAGLLFKTNEVIKLGNELATIDFTLSSGWSGDRQSGYTNSANNTNPITLDVPTESGWAYLLEYDVEIPVSSIEYCKAGIGSNPPSLTYNGTGHASVPLLADGGHLTLYPLKISVPFTIKNVSLKEIVDDGLEKILSLYNIISNNHTKNYGFWNVLLGASSAQNAVGATRTIVLGNFALSSLISGNRNIAIGTYSMNAMTNGENNISVGADSMEYVRSADSCIAIGKGTMGQGTGLAHCIAIGEGSLMGSSGSSNYASIAIGKDAGWSATGSQNVCIGFQAGESIGSGSANVAIGRSVNVNGGVRNISIGDRNNTPSGLNDTISLGREITPTKSNQMVLGGANITEVIMCGNKKIIFNADGSVTWETIS